MTITDFNMDLITQSEIVQPPLLLAPDHEGACFLHRKVVRCVGVREVRVSASTMRQREIGSQTDLHFMDPTINLKGFSRGKRRRFLLCTGSLKIEL
eukprot:CAMPEP_0178442972 /NCGR_PEP_ID=MMETSP0689_2-20121128/38537_1 /TAXON_ID=160604 /ORGANISM="Amphidinium massartii, Strain CS-259" /LENGTH=95 /DNA_ID=CAMNT_0020066729 /DNA_START=74 /DNA_END=361 /DNA_ORIENTATION=+